MKRLSNFVALRLTIAERRGVGVRTHTRTANGFSVTFRAFYDIQ